MSRPVHRSFAAVAQDDPVFVHPTIGDPEVQTAPHQPEIGAAPRFRWHDGIGAGLIACLLLMPSLLLAEERWRVAGAELRFELEITDQPSDACGGIIVTIPDGGLLPRPFPAAIVYDAAGHELANECLWHNPREGIGLVFAPPAAGKTVHVYFRTANSLNTLTRNSAFCPSLLLYTQMGSASLEAAKQLAGETPPARKGRFGLVDQIGHRENPFGADDQYISYYSGYMKSAERGQVWLATISDEGSEVHFDSRPVVVWAGKHVRTEGAKGQRGDWVQLTPERHRLEYFHFELAGDQEMHLVWTKPGQGADVLPETVPPAAFVHSGAARVIAANFVKPTAVAAVEAEPTGYTWLGDKPLNLFKLRANFTTTNPRGTTYRWELGDGMELKGEEVSWLIEGDAPRDVTLVATAPQGATKTTRPIYYDRPPAASNLLLGGDRAVYRDAFLTRCQAVLPPRRPCESWNSNLWTSVAGVLDPYEGWELLREIFDRSRVDVLALPPAARHELESYFWSAARGHDPQAALVWADRLQREEPDKVRKFDWQIQKVELLLYELGDAAKAKQMAKGLKDASQTAGTESNVRWLVRLGDIERLSGSLDQARKYYNEAADRFRKGKSDWRAVAVRQGSYYETADNLIQQKSWFDVRAVLRDWEVEFPLSKLDGDFPLVEAEFLKAVGQCDAAVRVTKAYRHSIGLSSYLPDAMELELDCLVQLKRHAALQELADDIHKRFPNMDLAEKAKALAAELGK